MRTKCWSVDLKDRPPLRYRHSIFIRCVGLEWINLAQDRFKFQVFVHTVKGFIKAKLL